MKFYSNLIIFIVLSKQSFTFVRRFYRFIIVSDRISIFSHSQLQQPITKLLPSFDSFHFFLRHFLSQRFLSRSLLYSSSWKISPTKTTPEVGGWSLPGKQLYFHGLLRERAQLHRTGIYGGLERANWIAATW